MSMICFVFQSDVLFLSIHIIALVLIVFKLLPCIQNVRVECIILPCCNLHYIWSSGATLYLYSQCLDWEVELVIVVGKEGKNIKVKLTVRYIHLTVESSE